MSGSGDWWRGLREIIGVVWCVGVVWRWMEWGDCVGEGVIDGFGEIFGVGDGGVGNFANGVEECGRWCDIVGGVILDGFDDECVGGVMCVVLCGFIGEGEFVKDVRRWRDIFDFAFGVYYYFFGGGEKGSGLICGESVEFDWW